MQERTHRPRRDHRTERLETALTFFRAATLVLFAIVAVETVALVWQGHKSRSAQAIRIDGQVACFVKNERAAEAVHDRLLKEGKGKLPGAAFLEQKWENLNWPLNQGDKVLSVRPGITDPASIAYRDESTLLAAAVDPERFYIEQIMPAKLALAARYVEQMSFLNDARVIGATLQGLWSRR